MNDWFEVLLTYDEIEAQIVKDLLEADGIKVVMDSLKVSPYPVNIGRIGEVRLLVGKEDLERAKRVISEINMGSEDTDSD